MQIIQKIWRAGFYTWFMNYVLTCAFIYAKFTMDEN